MSDQRSTETSPELAGVPEEVLKLGEVPIPAELEKAMVQDTPESETIPPWFGKVVKRVSDAWFDPKSFEKNPELFERLGVKKFKKYMPTTGDLMSRLVWKRLGLEDQVTPTLDSLQNFEKCTRVLESIHLTAFGVGVATMAWQLSAGLVEGAVFYAGMNVLFNVYPIMVQRYNRTRLYRAINKMQEREKRSTSLIPED